MQLSIVNKSDQLNTNSTTCPAGMDADILPSNGVVSLMIPGGSVSNVRFENSGTGYEVEKNTTEIDGTVSVLMETIQMSPFLRTISVYKQPVDVSVVLQPSSNGQTNLVANGEVVLVADCTETTPIPMGIIYDEDIVTILGPGTELTNITTLWYFDGFRFYRFNSSKSYEFPIPGKLFSSKNTAIYSIGNSLNTKIEDLLSQLPLTSSTPVLLPTRTVMTVRPTSTQILTTTLLPTTTTGIPLNSMIVTKTMVSTTATIGSTSISTITSSTVVPSSTLPLTRTVHIRTTSLAPTLTSVTSSTQAATVTLVPQPSEIFTLTSAFSTVSSLLASITATLSQRRVQPTVCDPIYIPMHPYSSTRRSSRMRTTTRDRSTPSTHSSTRNRKTGITGKRQSDTSRRGEATDTRIDTIRTHSSSTTRTDTFKTNRVNVPGRTNTFKIDGVTGGKRTKIFKKGGATGRRRTNTIRTDEALDTIKTYKAGGTPHSKRTSMTRVTAEHMPDIKPMKPTDSSIKPISEDHKNRLRSKTVKIGRVASQKFSRKRLESDVDGIAGTIPVKKKPFRNPPNSELYALPWKQMSVQGGRKTKSQTKSNKSKHKTKTLPSRRRCKRKKKCRTQLAAKVKKQVLQSWTVTEWSEVIE